MNPRSKSISHFLILFALLASLVGSALMATPAHAASWTVCASGCNYSTIGAAVAAVSTNDTINVEAGTYHEHDIEIPINLSIVGAGSGSVTVDAGQLGRVFYVDGSVTASISGMTITNGKVTDDYGSGIYNNNGTLTLNDVIVTNNSNVQIAYFYGSGGGVFNMGTLTMTNSQVTSNTTVYQGGGIDSYFGSTLHLTNVLIQGNTMSGPNGNGAGISISSGSSTGDASTVTLDRVTVDDNTGGYEAGGINVQDDASVTITNSTISNNGGNSFGIGGIFIGLSTTLTMTNSTISGNNGSGGGAFVAGGLYTDAGSTTTLTNDTFANNTAGDGGGIYSQGTVNMKNTILANTATAGSPDCGGGVAINSQDHNLIQDISGCTITGSPTHDIYGSDPMLNALANNGGPTKTQSLQSGSPAINAASSCPATDQRGVTRFSGVPCDIGAFEYGPKGTINQAAGQPDPTIASPIHFTAIFNEPINPTTFTPTLTGTAVTSGVSAIVTTSNNVTFDVAVSGMTVPGTMIASIPASVQDPSGNPIKASSSTDHTVTFGSVLTHNGGFNTYVGASKIPQYWTASNLKTTDGKDTTVHQEGTASVKIIGASGVTKTLTQTLVLSGLAGNKFRFSFQASGSSIPAGGMCAGQVKLYSGTKLISTQTVNCATGTYGFQLKSLNFTAPKAYNKVVIVFTYSKASGTVWFDTVSLLSKS